MPTYAEAAVEAFERTNDEPKTVKEIWEIIENHGLKESSGKTPWATLGVELSRYSDKPYVSVEQQEPVLFKRNTNQEKDTYELAETDDKGSLSSESDVEPTGEEPVPEEKTTRITEVTSPQVDWKKIAVVNNNGNLEYWEEECESYTYFFTDKDKDFVKIGKTKDKLESRKRSLKTSRPKGSIEAVIPETRISEDELHERFSNLHHEREWYFVSSEVKNIIDRESDLSEKVAKRYNLEKKMEKLDENILDLAGV